MFSARITWLKAIKEALCVLTMGTNAHCTMEHIFGVIGTCMGNNVYCIMKHFFEVIGTCMGNIAYSIMGHILGVIGTCIGTIAYSTMEHIFIIICTCLGINVHCINTFLWLLAQVPIHTVKWNSFYGVISTCIGINMYCAWDTLKHITCTSKKKHAWKNRL